LRPRFAVRVSAVGGVAAMSVLSLNTVVFLCTSTVSWPCYFKDRALREPLAVKTIQAP
jgi:hypothetical protein